MALGTLVLVLFLIPTTLSAQVSVVTHSVSPGDRLRIEYATGSERHKTVGRLISSNGTRVILSAHADSTAIAVGEITKVERVIGREGHAKKGMLIGAAIGVIPAVAIAVDSQDDWFDKGTAVGIAAGVFVACALVGLGIGAAATTEVWQPVDPAALAVEVSSFPGNGVGVAFRLRL